MTYIELKVTENPKRKGSLAHKRFSHLMKMNGASVEEFKELENKYPDLGKYWTTLELWWAQRQDLVKLRKTRLSVAA